MTWETQHPTCTHCGSRIGVRELAWRELASGAIRGAYASDLDGRRREGRGLWHLGCLPLARHADLAPDHRLGARGSAGSRQAEISAERRAPVQRAF
jgi:hypothetical protein